MAGFDQVGVVTANPAGWPCENDTAQNNFVEEPSDCVDKPVFAHFDEYFKADAKRLVALLVKLGAEVHDAADIAQEVLIDIFRRWDKIDSPRDWARHAALRRCYKISASRKHETLVDAVPDSPRSTLLSPEYYAETVESARSARALLALLSEQQRLVMAFLSDGYDHRETARLIGTTPATVAQAARRARRILKDHILADRQAKEDR
ncbi:RNA polymerase sigma factor [Amycolatopsis lexingtonensis]|uniref:RNA polymerase sigma factor n=1 Tax=Amycolatopsis lexingtonensis TaxID=218822 RepID=UPI003F709845